MGSNTFRVQPQSSLAGERLNEQKMMLYVLLAAFAVGAQATCDSRSANPASAQDVANYRETCIAALSKQVKMELEASLQYLLMAAQFSQDNYDLPGVAKLFWEHADEERDHAKKLIDYLRLRGSLENDFFGGKPIKPILGKSQWGSVAEALRDALKMEKAVSGMKQMIDLCSQGGEDDPHAADWLTGTWLEEQLNGQRHLAGLINSLESFSRDHTELGEWMFARKSRQLRPHRTEYRAEYH